MDPEGLALAALGLLATFGYLALFVLMALEGSRIAWFIPSEAILVAAAGLLAGTPASFWFVIGIATAGATVGHDALYLAARAGGRRALAGRKRWLGVPPERLAQMESWFRKPGAPALLLASRALPLVRSFGSVPAGLATMQRGRFLAATFVGNAVYNSALVAIAVAALRPASKPGRAVAEMRDAVAVGLSHPWMLAGGAILAALLLAGIVALVVARRRSRREVSEA